mgnify:CR=1 FL=1
MIFYLLVAAWLLFFWGVYMFHVVRMRIRERLVLMRCRLVNMDDADVLVLRENMNKIEMLLNF